jgi:DNA-directed RNA polymerase subunit RPC12/RpoP
MRGSLMNKKCPYCGGKLTRKDARNGLICNPGSEIYRCRSCNRISGGINTFTLDDFPEFKVLVEKGIKDVPPGIPEKKIIEQNQ